MLVCFTSVRAQRYVNYDYKTTGQVTINTAAIKLAEIEHNEKVDSIKKKHEKLSALIGTLASYKGLFLETLENVKGFGHESGIYKSIIKKSANIAKYSVSATEAVYKTNFNGKAICAFKIQELVMEAAHLGNVFFNIVCNGTVKNPLKLNGSNDNKDKLNLLNRNERLNMALTIDYELGKIERSLIALEYYCKHNSFQQLLSHIDQKTYVTFIHTRLSTNYLIDRWKGLKQ